MTLKQRFGLVGKRCTWQCVSSSFIGLGPGESSGNLMTFEDQCIKEIFRFWVNFPTTQQQQKGDLLVCQFHAIKDKSSQGGLKCSAKDNICQSCWTFFYSEKNSPKQTNLLHIDASSLLIGPMPVKSPLMGSKQHVSSFCKPNQCCPFLHSLVPLAL